jgi:hypothetical protein
VFHRSGYVTLEHSRQQVQSFSRPIVRGSAMYASHLVPVCLLSIDCTRHDRHCARHFRADSGMGDAMVAQLRARRTLVPPVTAW